MRVKKRTQAKIWILVGLISIACAAPTDDEVSTVQKLQNTIKAMEAMLEKQQKRLLVGFDGMRKRVNALEKMANKTRKEMELNKDAICPNLSSPFYGRVLGGRRKSPGDLAYYVCDFGFNLQGNEERICLNNGTWSGINPTCQSVFPINGNQFIRNSDCLNSDPAVRVCSCPIGFKLSEDQDRCTDVDECSDIMDGERIMRVADCQYKCRNQPGSYECFCPPGYIIDASRRCTDEDECAAGVHNCSSSNECVNTFGGFECASIVCPHRYIKTGEKLCQKIPCKIDDDECHSLPFSIMYHYMAITPTLEIPARIFRLTTDSGFDRSITRFSIAPGKDSFYFTSRRVDRRTAWLVLSQRPSGSTTLNVEFQAKEHSRHGQKIAKHVARVVIYVSEYAY